MLPQGSQLSTLSSIIAFHGLKDSSSSDHNIHKPLELTILVKTI